MLQKDILIEYTIYISYNMYISVDTYIYIYIYMKKTLISELNTKVAIHCNYLFYFSVCFYRLFLNII